MRTKTSEIVQTLGYPTDVIEAQLALAGELERDFLLGDLPEADFFKTYQTITDARKVRAINSVLDSGGEMNDIFTLKDGFVSVTPVWEGRHLHMGKISGDKIDVPFENIFSYIPESGILIYTDLEGLSLKGGPGSGNFGHGGLAGVHGGSSPTVSISRSKVEMVERALEKNAENMSSNSQYHKIDVDDDFSEIRGWITPSGDFYGVHSKTPNKFITHTELIGEAQGDFPEGVADKAWDWENKMVEWGFVRFHSGPVGMMFGMNKHNWDKTIIDAKLPLSQQARSVVRKLLRKFPDRRVEAEFRTDGIQRYFTHGVESTEWYLRRNIADREPPKTLAYKGGPGSGNHGHSGLAGVHGGSSPTTNLGMGEDGTWQGSWTETTPSGDEIFISEEHIPWAPWVYESDEYVRSMFGEKRKPVLTDKYPRNEAYVITPTEKVVYGKSEDKKYSATHTQLYAYLGLSGYQQLTYNERERATFIKYHDENESFEKIFMDKGYISIRVRNTVGSSKRSVEIKSTQPLSKRLVRKVQSFYDKGLLPPRSYYDKYIIKFHDMNKGEYAEVSLDKLDSVSGFRKWAGGLEAVYKEHTEKGGPGSGNWGHGGLEGVHGGSSPTKGSSYINTAKKMPWEMSRDEFYNTPIYPEPDEGHRLIFHVTNSNEALESIQASGLLVERGQSESGGMLWGADKPWNDRPLVVFQVPESDIGDEWSGKPIVEHGDQYTIGRDIKPENILGVYPYNFEFGQRTDIMRSWQSRPRDDDWWVSFVEYALEEGLNVPDSVKKEYEKFSSETTKGGPGSGNWGHGGLEGVHGGSSPKRGWNPKFGGIDDDWVKSSFKPVAGLSSEEVCFKTFERVCGLYLDPDISLEQNIKNILEKEPQRLHKMSQTIYNYLENETDDWKDPTIYNADRNYEEAIIPREHIELVQSVIDPLYEQRISYIQRALGIPSSPDGLREFLGEDAFKAAMQLRIFDEEAGHYLYGEDYHLHRYKVEARLAEKFAKIPNEAMQSIYDKEFGAALSRFLPYEGLDNAHEVYELAEHIYEYEIMKRLCSGDLQQEKVNSYIKDRNHFNDFYLQDLLNGRDFTDLPDKLYHVTTDASGIEESGIMSRRELAWHIADKNEVGLGGGSDITISFTEDKATADGIYRAINEAHAVANGKYSMESMIVDAIRGGRRTGDAKPFLHTILGRHSESPTYYEKFIDSNGNLKIKDILKDGGLTARIRQPLEYEAGISSMDRNRYMELLWDLWHSTFIGQRAAAGGFMNPLFWGTDWKKLARLDPKDFAILEYIPKSGGAKGVLMGSLGEWRVVGNSAIKLENIIQEVWEDFDLSKWLGGV